MTLLGVFSGKDMQYTYPNGDKVCNVSAIYICSDYSGELLPQTDETSELRWFALDDVPENISPPDIRPMKAFLEYMKNT